MRFHNIQALRVLAALGVIVVHLPVYAARDFGVPDCLGSLSWAGNCLAFPVPLFFAVSGFVLTHALHSTSPHRFLLARFLRLYPGYWLAIGVAVVNAWLTICPSEINWKMRLALFKQVGFTLTPRGPGKAICPLMVEWSLVYEVALSVGLLGLSLLGLRRGLPLAAGVWLAVLIGKLFVRPGYATDTIPLWGWTYLSAFDIPFVLGVLAYYLRDRGRRWRWVVFAGLVAGIASVLPRVAEVEWLWAVLGLFSAATVWFAVQVRQVSASHPVTRIGDFTYGLYLVHVPVMLTGFYVLRTRGWLVGTDAGAWLVGVAAIVFGLLFGRIESWPHSQLRPLAKVRPTDATRWLWVRWHRAGLLRAGQLRSRRT